MIDANAPVGTASRGFWPSGSRQGSSFVHISDQRRQKAFKLSPKWARCAA